MFSVREWLQRIHEMLLKSRVPGFCMRGTLGMLVLACLSGCGSRQAAAEAPAQSHQAQPAPEARGQAPYAGEPQGEVLPSDCAAQTSSVTCFPTVEAACQSLGCADNRCSIGYSLPPMISCAGPGEQAWVPE